VLDRGSFPSPGPSAVTSDSLQTADLANGSSDDGALVGPVTAVTGNGILLKRVGNTLKNPQGGSVVLRGVNYSDWSNDPGGQWRANGETLWQGNYDYRSSAVIDNLDTLVAWGCNVIRVHIAAEEWKNDPRNFRANFQNFLGLARSRGIYVMVVVYSGRVYPNNGQFELPYGSYVPAGPDRDLLPTRQSFVDLWASIATVLKGYDNLLFEPYNEPHGDTTVEAEYFAMMQSLITAVRATGAQQPIVVQWDFNSWTNVQFLNGSTLHWVYDYALNDPQNNLIISTHTYANCAHVATGNVITNVSDVYASMGTYTAASLIERVSQEFPLLIGEIGAADGNAQEARFMATALKRFNDLGIGYLGWSWSTSMGYSLLQGDIWVPAPSDRGTILIQAITSGKAKPAWDINQDGVVNVQDMILIQQHFGETGVAGWIREDVNGDGLVNVMDQIIVGQYWTG
jgi:hypothetical protein